jgi:hypothetical protein
VFFTVWSIDSEQVGISGSICILLSDVT